MEGDQLSSRSRRYKVGRFRATQAQVLSHRRTVAVSARLGRDSNRMVRWWFNRVVSCSTKRRTERQFWQVNQLSYHSFMQAEGHLLFRRRVPMTNGVRQHLKLSTELPSGYVVSACIR
jgi:hypothetical protein